MLEFKKICFIDITTPKTFGKVKVKAILGTEITNQNIERPFFERAITQKDVLCVPIFRAQANI